MTNQSDGVGDPRRASGASNPRNASGPADGVGFRPISAPEALNEATAYEPVGASFSRGTRVDLGAHAILFISGTASVDETGASVHPGDLPAQTRRAFENVTALLASEGAGWADVARIRCFLADMAGYQTFNLARSAFFEAHGVDPVPASTCVEARLCRPELMVEIEAVAIVSTP
jgi:enamine deaminase RidA (YjgF/YER057c/UK114 family)